MDDFKFKKKFGQNFLQNKNIIKKIVDISFVDSESLIIEVGPGSGNLTIALADKYKNSNILAYEIDNSLKDILTSKFEQYKNVNVIFGDFLKRNLLLDTSKFKYNKLYFISNVPYYITTPILFKIIESDLSFEKIVIMVQKEVGDRFCSHASTKDYGALTVILNYFFDIRKEIYVDRNQFYPKPNVDSVVVSFTKKEIKNKVADIDYFIKFVHDCFQYKRKNLRNNLKKYNLDIIERVLAKYGYDLTVRAEALDYTIFVNIVNVLMS